MQLSTVNYLNIFLMLVSFGLAFVLPFEFFLFSYAFLGPLHYLTELSWLRDRRCFTTGRFDWAALIFLTIPLVLPLSLRIERLAYWGAELLFMVFFAALIFVVSANWKRRLPALAGLFLAAVLLHRGLPVVTRPYQAIFSIYLPTLIHVFVFTGVFILFGALKSKSGSGYLSFGIFLTLALAMLLLSGEAGGYAPDELTRKNYSQLFQPLHIALAAHFSSQDLDSVRALFLSDFNVRLGRFIAFAYSYHFLNWFSKTSVIRWHEVSRWRVLLVLGIWLLSIALYSHDFVLGFSWLYALSLVHVVLEFPLNHHAFIGIGRELRLRLAGRS